MNIMWINVISRVRLAGQTAILHDKNTMLGISCKVFNFLHTCHACRHHWLLPFYITMLGISCKVFNILHTCHACRHHWLVPFYITFNVLIVSKVLLKAKPIHSIVLHTFQLIRMKFDLMLKQFRLNILTLFWVRFNVAGEINAVLQTASEN